MKPVHVLAGLGAILILGFGGWYLYMQRTPPYEQATTRGLDIKSAKPAAELGAKPAKAAKSDAAAQPAKAAPSGK